MSEPIRLDVVVQVGDHALTRVNLGHRAVHAMTREPEFTQQGPDRWTSVDHSVSPGLFSLAADPDTTVADFARTALGASGEDNGEVMELWLEDAVTGDRLPDEARLADHLDNGDLVLLQAQTPPDADYMLGSLGEPEGLFDTLHVAAALEVAAWPRLWGALLYTEEDTAVATYVRTHFDELNAMSGKLLRIFVVERPESWRRAKKYWRAHLEPPLLRTLSVLRWLSWTPYDKSGLYEVARELGVDPAQFPCLVLFGGSGNGTLVFPIESADPAWFRGLFSEIHRAAGDAPSDYPIWEAAHHFDTRDQHEQSARGAEALRVLAASASWADRAALARVEEVKTSLLRTAFTGHNVVIAHGTVGDITFHGPTTFINKPVNTVIKDFQNTHGTRQAELLSLALNSEDLSPEEHVEMARRVTRLAEHLERPGDDPYLLRHAMGLVESSARGKDIAGRVAEIVRGLRDDLKLR